jgi:hypothetical protein
MNRYLIEVTHDPTHADCGRLADTLTQAGAHFLTRAGWGCQSGIHCCWLLVEALTDEDAELIVPPALRCNGRIVRLDNLAIEDLQNPEPDETREDIKMNTGSHSHWPTVNGPYFNPDGPEPGKAFDPGGRSLPQASGSPERRTGRSSAGRDSSDAEAPAA